MPKKPKTPPPAPVDATRQLVAFISAAGVIRKTWDAYHSFFLIDKQRREWLYGEYRALSDVVAMSLSVTCYILLAQLDDPDISMGDPHKRNLTLSRVIAEASPPVGTAERTQIEAAYAKMQPLFAKLKDWRNSVGAHKDLLTSLDILDHLDNPLKTANPIPFIGNVEMFEALTCLVEITDLIVNHHTPGEIWYDYDVSDDVEKLFVIYSKKAM